VTGREVLVPFNRCKRLNRIVAVEECDATKA